MVHGTSDAPSSKPHPRARRRAETVSELLDQAERIVLNEGLESLSMHRLAAEHGVRVGALYRYWPSKDALLSALLSRAVARIRERIAAAPAWQADVAAREPWTERERALLRVARMGAVYFQLARERPETTSLMSHFLAPARVTFEPEAGSPLVADALALIAEVSAAFDEAVRVGALAPGPSLERAAILWTSLQGLVSAAKLTRFRVTGDAAQLERALLGTLLRGWGADPAAIFGPVDRALVP